MHKRAFRVYTFYMFVCVVCVCCYREESGVQCTWGKVAILCKVVRDK